MYTGRYWINKQTCIPNLMVSPYIYKYCRFGRVIFYSIDHFQMNILCQSCIILEYPVAIGLNYHKKLNDIADPKKGGFVYAISLPRDIKMTWRLTMGI